MIYYFFKKVEKSKVVAELQRWSIGNVVVI